MSEDEDADSDVPIDLGEPIDIIISTTRGAGVILQALVDTGLYGDTVEDAARRVLERELEAIRADRHFALE